MLAADFFVFITILSAANSMETSAPKTLNTTSGSCLLIPCQFKISKENEKYLDLSPVGTWRTWSSAHRQMQPLINVVGDLRKKNCTSVMMNLTSQHSARYYFWLSVKNFNVSSNKALRIGVSDSLAEPYVIVPRLREGEVGNLTCTVPAPCPSNPPNVTWDPALGGNITRLIQMNADGTQNVSAILNFVPSFHHHELNVSCVSMHLLERQDKPLPSHKTVILNVEYAPKETQISSGWLGNNVTLTCQSNANPPAVHRWFVKKEDIVEEVGASRVLSFTVTHNNSGEYICEAQNQHGAGKSTILQINVPGTLKTSACPNSEAGSFKGRIRRPSLHHNEGCPDSKAPSDVASKLIAGW
ncbi:myelin-associated glycoprotein [Pimephales promelas]|nr:myelin-associated glycoprotein [Pimephales promelas]